MNVDVVVVAVYEVRFHQRGEKCPDQWRFADIVSFDVHYV